MDIGNVDEKVTKMWDRTFDREQKDLEIRNLKGESHEEDFIFAQKLVHLRS